MGILYRTELIMSANRPPTLMVPHAGGPCVFLAPSAPQPPGIWDNMAALSGDRFG
jgi:hypothetical protein